MYEFGEILKKLREERGLSQAQLARKINKSNSVISNYETGAKLPSTETLISLAALFDVPLDYLCGLDKKRAIVVEGLSESQISIMNTILLELRDHRPRRDGSLTKRQVDILSSLLVEFCKEP